jgi:hypothetical protein
MGFYTIIYYMSITVKVKNCETGLHIPELQYASYSEREEETIYKKIADDLVSDKDGRNRMLSKKGLIAEYQIKDPVDLNKGINQNITRIEIY